MCMHAAAAGHSTAPRAGFDPGQRTSLAGVGSWCRRQPAVRARCQLQRCAPAAAWHRLQPAARRRRPEILHVECSMSGWSVAVQLTINQRDSFKHAVSSYYASSEGAILRHTAVDYLHLVLPGHIHTCKASGHLAASVSGSSVIVVARGGSGPSNQANGPNRMSKH